LGVPAVNIGDRQAGRERGRNVIDVAYKATEIRAAIDAHMKNGRYASETIYGDGKAGERIAELLANQELRIAKQIVY
jgi:hypothetical protein